MEGKLNTKKSRKFRSSQAGPTAECPRTWTLGVRGGGGAWGPWKPEKNTCEKAIQETQETSSLRPGTTLRANWCAAGESGTSKDWNHHAPLRQILLLWNCWRTFPLLEVIRSHVKNTIIGQDIRHNFWRWFVNCECRRRSYFHWSCDHLCSIWVGAPQRWVAGYRSVVDTGTRCGCRRGDRGGKDGLRWH